MNLLDKSISKGTVIKTNQSVKLTIDGHTETYTVYKVRLDALYFNDQNDRISTWISQHKADNNIDIININDKEEHNKLIHKFIEESNPESIKKTKSNIKRVGQLRPGVILADGRIINGNRRVTCLRDLCKDNERFKYFETVILEIDLENHAKQIKKLELMIQHGEESQTEYNPIDRLVGIYNDIIDTKLLTVEEYADSCNTTVKKIKQDVELANLLVEFLEIINAPGKFYIARDLCLDGPLRELQGILKKINDKDKREDIKNIVFVNLLMQPHGDMTRFIRKIKKVVSSGFLNEYLEEQLDIAEEVLDKLPEEGKMSKQIVKEKFRSDDITRDKLRRSLEIAEEKAKSSESRNKPLHTLEKIGDLLKTIDTSIFIQLKYDEKKEIVSQIDIIKKALNKIKDDTNV